jgi:hypothetical protein
VVSLSPLGMRLEIANEWLLREFGLVKELVSPDISRTWYHYIFDTISLIHDMVSRIWWLIMQDCMDVRGHASGKVVTSTPKRVPHSFLC